MKLLCIKRHTTNNIGRADVPGPDSGDEVIAVDEKNFKGRPFYRLQEYPEFEGKRLWYDAQNFVQTNTDLDETTLVNEEWEQKVCEPA